MSAADQPPGAGAGGVELFEQHDQAVADFAARQGLHGVAIEELVAKVFARAQQGGPPAAAQSPVGWLHHLALQTHREICASLRGQYSHGEGGTTARPDPATREARRALALARRALGELPGPLHEVFSLFELEGHPCAQIAGLLGVPLAAVTEQLLEARRRFLLVHYELSLESDAGDSPRPPEGSAP